MCLNGIKGSKNGFESENAKIPGENNVDCISYVKGIIHHEFVPKRKVANCKFCKEMIKGLVG
jgi:hypothetical protein